MEEKNIMFNWKESVRFYFQQTNEKSLKCITITLWMLQSLWKIQFYKNIEDLRI